jgi:hypothetical protein
MCGVFMHVCYYCHCIVKMPKSQYFLICHLRFWAKLLCLPLSDFIKNSELRRQYDTSIIKVLFSVYFNCNISYKSGVGNTILMILSKTSMFN